MKYRSMHGITAALFVFGTQAASADPNQCQTHRIVDAKFMPTESERKMNASGEIVGGHYFIELDDGHVVRATFGRFTPRTSELIDVCTFKSKIDGKTHVGITLHRPAGDPAGTTRNAVLIK